MNETDNHPTAPNPDAESERSHEPPGTPPPRIYVASLADYNNGRLHGRWIDAARDPAAIHADIAAMLANSQEPGAEEWAIHDYEHFGSCQIHEYDTIELVSRIATGIAEHGGAFAAWADIHEGSTDMLDSFTDAYFGHYDSLRDYAEQLVDELGYTAELDALPESLRPYVYIDNAAIARDMEHSGDLYIAPDPDGGVWLFGADN